MPYSALPTPAWHVALALSDHAQAMVYQLTTILGVLIAAPVVEIGATMSVDWDQNQLTVILHQCQDLEEEDLSEVVAEAALDSHTEEADLAAEVEPEAVVVDHAAFAKTYADDD